MSKWTWAAAAAIVVGAAGPAAADDQGFVGNNFRPATDPFGYAQVNGARSLDMFQFHLAGYVNWAKNPLQFPDEIPAPGGKDILREVTTIDAVAGLGLLKFGNAGVQVGVDVPIVIHTYGLESDDRDDHIHAEGFGDIRAEAKGTLFDREDDIIGLGARLFFTFPVENEGGEDFRSNNEEINVGGTIIVEKKLGILRLGAEVGFESFQGEINLGDVEVDDKLTFGFGVGISPIPSLESLEIFGELIGHTRFTHPFDESEESPMELGAGVRVGGDSTLFALVGINFGMVDGFGEADARVYGAIGFTF